MDSAPPQGERCGAVPLGKHGSMPRPALHPDVVNREMEIGEHTAEALKPAAQGFLVVALTTKRVGAGNAVMDIRRDCFHRLIPAMIVYVVEALSDRFLDNSCIAFDLS